MVARKKAEPGETVAAGETQEFEAQLEQEGFGVNSSGEVPDETVENVEAATAEPEAESGLVQELEGAREEARQAKDQLLRLAAEFENYKKRMEREKNNALKYAEENILKELLPTIDNLERAMEQGKAADTHGPLLEGVEMTLKLLLDTLAKYGLQPLAGVGQPFDPNFHEALVMEPSDTVPANHIIQEYEKGYVLKDRLIRAAKVVVAKEA